MVSSRGNFAKRVQSTLVTRLSKKEFHEFTLLVGGVERGGTSMVAAVLGELGVDMGPRGMNHEDPNMLIENDSFVIEYVERRNKECSRWGFKHPSGHRSALLRRINFNNPIWIFVFRNPVANLESLVARGSPGLIASFDTIVSGYCSMREVVQQSSASIIMVSYERASAYPEQFAREIAGALGLDATQEQLMAASTVVTGDGGGYRALGGQEHYIDVRPPAFDVACERVESRPAFEAGGVHVLFSISRPRQCEAFRVMYDSQNPRYVTIIFDFGNGFSGMAAYDILVPESGYVVEVEHEGAVSQIGFGTRSADDFKPITLFRTK